MEGLKRSFKFWFCGYEKYFWIVFAFVMVICFVVAGILDQTYFEVVSRYVPAMGIITIMAQSTSMTNTYLTLSVSHGATRKEALFGMTVMTHILIAQMVIVQVLCYALMPEQNVMKESAGFLTGLLLIVGAMSNVVSVLSLKFGNMVAFIVYFIVTFSSFVIIMSLADEDLPFTFIQNIRLHYMVIAAAIIDIIAVFFNFKVMRRYEVKW